ncbi:MAG: 3-dehydroquinate synthase [Acetobacteraceae bacterium]
MSRNLPLRDPPAPIEALAGRSLVLVGLMGAGKTSIGRRLAARLGLPFRDADIEIEAAAGCSISEFFERFGEQAFRDGEKRVIRRLLAGDPVVLATGGGAFMDPDTRALMREFATTIWLDCPIPVLSERVAGRAHRPLLTGTDPAETLARLSAARGTVYAEADLTIACQDESPEATTTRVLTALLAWRRPRTLSVTTGSRGYELLIGRGLLARAGALLAPVLPQKRVMVVTDESVARLHLAPLLEGLARTGIRAESFTVPAGESAKSFACFERLVDEFLAAAVDRRTTVLALGGGVVGDLAGFAAAATMRGLPLVQIPTTLLAQVDSSVGGKTGINSPRGKNLVGAFHQPLRVLADTDTLATLPEGELRAGYAEIVKAGLIGDPGFFAWCEAHGAAVLAGNTDAQAEAILRAAAFKAAVVGDDEREEKPQDGRALLNLGHTFAHALEAETRYSGALLHGEAVAIGTVLAFRLSVALGYCAEGEAARVDAHLGASGLPTGLDQLNRRFSAARLIDHMRRDKKMRDGALHFVLARGIGRAFTCPTVPPQSVTELLREAGCEE